MFLLLQKQHLLAWKWTKKLVRICSKRPSVLSLDLNKISKGVKKHEICVAQKFNSVLSVSQRKAASYQLGTPSHYFTIYILERVSSLAATLAIGFVPHSWVLIFPPDCRKKLLPSACLCLFWVFQSYLARYDPDGSLYRAKKPRRLTLLFAALWAL